MNLTFDRYKKKTQLSLTTQIQKVKTFAKIEGNVSTTPKKKKKKKQHTIK
jgi:hypothetical protein